MNLLSAFATSDNDRINATIPACDLVRFPWRDDLGEISSGRLASLPPSGSLIDILLTWRDFEQPARPACRRFLWTWQKTKRSASANHFTGEPLGACLGGGCLVARYMSCSCGAAFGRQHSQTLILNISVYGEWWPMLKGEQASRAHVIRYSDADRQITDGTLRYQAGREQRIW